MIRAILAAGAFYICLIAVQAAADVAPPQPSLAGLPAWLVVTVVIAILIAVIVLLSRVIRKGGGGRDSDDDFTPLPDN